MGSFLVFLFLLCVFVLRILSWPGRTTKGSETRTREMQQLAESLGLQVDVGPHFPLLKYGSQKDTPNNILATSEFVVNIVNEPLAQQMNICAASLPADESEIDLAGLQTLTSIEVAPPRLAASPASFECRYQDSAVRFMVASAINSRFGDQNNKVLTQVRAKVHMACLAVIC